MIRSLVQRLEAMIRLRTGAAAEAANAEDRRALNLAAAALFIEVVRSDFASVGGEREAVLAAISELLELAPGEAEKLLAEAEAEVDQSVSLYEFTSIIHQHFDADRKLELLERLWRVAFADGRLDSHEEHMLRRLQGLLHVDQKDFIATKLRARGKTATG